MSVKSTKKGKKKSGKQAGAPPAGTRILFKPNAAGKPSRRGEFLRVVESGVFEVKLEGDPFTVCVSSEQVTINNTSPIETEEVSKMPSTATATKPSAKELRRKAKSLGIQDWEEMSLKQLTAAVAEAEKAASKKGTKSTSKKGKKARAVEPVAEDEDDEDTDEDEEEEAPVKTKSKKTAAAKSKKAPAKKAATKKVAADEDDDEDELPENGNPFRNKSNLWYIAEEVIKGGKRSKMVGRLKKKITLNPRSGKADFDETAELDRRVLIVGQILKNEHGFEVTREGRGPDATIVAVAPED